MGNSCIAAAVPAAVVSNPLDDWKMKICEFLAQLSALSWRGQSVRKSTGHITRWIDTTITFTPERFEADDWSVCGNIEGSGVSDRGNKLYNFTLTGSFTIIAGETRATIIKTHVDSTAPVITYGLVYESRNTGCLTGSDMGATIDVALAANAGGVECSICLDRPRSAAFAPCGHLTACTACAAKMKTCPICRAAVESTLIIIPV